VLRTDRRGQGRRIALVHGFTQTRRCWGPVADDLAGDHEVVAIDAPGHGRSASVPADPWRSADLLAAAGGDATYLGYSMGGRLCLHLALAHPRRVRGLVLVGATAGIEDPAQRAARRAEDEARARRLEAEGLDAFLDAWLAQPLFAGLPEEAACRPARRENTVAGLAASLRLAGTGAQEPLWHRLAALAMPVLVLAGEHDERFAALGRRLVAAVGDNATLALVAGAGHAAHLEAPAAFVGVLRPWLATHRL
jgi:2-succinyl-6-hydroxy-2,4-cyclohexadiene-1-carboxylate synthase